MNPLFLVAGAAVLAVLFGGGSSPAPPGPSPPGPTPPGAKKKAPPSPFPYPLPTPGAVWMAVSVADTATPPPTADPEHTPHQGPFPAAQYPAALWQSPGRWAIYQVHPGKVAGAPGGVGIDLVAFFRVLPD